MFGTLLTPFSELQQMIDSMDRAFGTLWSNTTRPNPSAVYTLPVDIWQKENVCYIRAAVPGVHPDNLGIEVQENVLTIIGEWPQLPAGQDGVSLWRRELAAGKFARSIRLPEFAMAEQIEAAFDNGFVTITVPLAIQPPKVLRVPVKTASGQPALQRQTQALEQNAESVHQKGNATNGKAKAGASA